MNNLRKDQIIVIAVCVGLGFLIIFLIYYQFFTEEETIAVEQSAPIGAGAVPEIPVNPNDVFADKSRLEQAEAIRKQQEDNIADAKKEIDLQVFTFDQETPAPPSEAKEEPEVKPQKRQASVSRKRTSTPKPQPQQTQVVEQPKQEETYVDPDLVFADASFTDNTTENTTSSVFSNQEAQIPEGSVQISAVIQDEVTITDGSRVTVRIIEESTVNGQTIQRNSYVHTIARLRRRIELEVPPIRDASGSIIPGEFVIVDAADNLEGLYSQELLNTQLAQDQTSEMANEVANSQSNALVRSGIRALGTKKVKETKVTLKRNQPVYLIKTR